MLKQNKGKLLLSTVILLLPMSVGLILWNAIPDSIPIHWNVAGEVDGWASKPMAVFGMSGFILAIHWVCLLITAADPKHKNIQGKPLDLVLWICPFLSLLSHTFVYAGALGYDLSIQIILPLLMGGMFFIIGNYLPKCKQNYTIGIKVPWALNDEENWNKTHRFAGRLWVIGGAVIMVTSLFGSFVSFFGIVLIMAFAPMLYSYLYYRRQKKETD